MKKCNLIIHDEVNISFDGLDPKARRACNEALKHFLPHARHTPAFKLGRWDGTVSLFAINGNSYLNLLDRIIPVLTAEGYEIDNSNITDNRKIWKFNFPKVDENYITNHMPNGVWPKGHPAEGQPILLREHQVNAVNSFLENPQSLGELATGAGKTIITAVLSHLCEPYGRSIIIVPNKSLVEQTAADYINLGLDVGVYYGDKKEIGKTHTICTWQSLDRLSKGTSAKTKTNKTDFDAFLKDVVCVMVDEAHGAKSDVLKNMLAGAFADIPIRWGLTGTIPKDPHAADVILACLGPVASKVAAKELMDKGILSSCHVDIIQLMDYLEFDSYHEEYEYLVTDETRLEYISQFINSVAETGNTLILVNRVATGKTLHEIIPNSTFVSGGTKSGDRTDAYDSIADNNNEILIATYGVAAVGLNIPRIFNLILLEPGKSFVRVIQSIGRGIRRAKDKDFVQIYDITSNCKYSAAHLTKRKKFYKDAEYPFTVNRVEYKNTK